jgi:hypothetical protein
MLPFDDIYEAALALPRVQREELIELLAAGLAGDDESEFDFARKFVLEQFPAEDEDVAGPIDLIPWDEVRRRVSARLTSDD